MELYDIFQNISEESLEKMKTCFNGIIKHYSSQSTIMSYDNAPKMVGIILSGSANLVKYEDDGNVNIIEQLMPHSIFGEIFVRTFDDSDFSVLCTSDCSVLFFDYTHLTHQCQNACEHHAQLINNLFQMMSVKTTELLTRIDILGHRTMRGKLMSYFLHLKKENKSRTFTLPFPLYTLADFLFVDRSAMLREMKKMREEGLIDSHGRKITVLKSM